MSRVRKSIGWVVLALFASTSSVSAGKVVTIVGTDNVLVDSAALQAALDAATPGTTLELVGEFQLDGGLSFEASEGLAIGASLFVRTSHITIAGRRVDNDGDGLINEDPENGIDDDGDGLVDEDDRDAVLKGVLLGDGSPAGDCDHPDAVAACTNLVLEKLFNRGMQFGDVRGVTVQDLKFEGHSRALPVSSILNTKGFLCEGIVFTGDEVHKLTLQGNSFTNNFRDFQIFGQGDKVKFSDNDVTHLSAGLPILLVGKESICSNGTEFIPLPVGVAVHTNISGNRIRRGGSGTAVLTSETEFTTFAQNDVSGASFGLILEDDTQITVLQNDISDTIFGMLLLDAAEGAHVANNRVTANVFGIFVDECVVEATGYTMINNDITAGALDIFLGEGSFENTVIATDFVTSVADLGFDNQLIGTLAMISNPGVPDEVRQMLEELRDMLGMP